MKKIFIKRAIIEMSSLFIIGVICLFNSTKAGENARFKAFQKYRFYLANLKRQCCEIVTYFAALPYS